MLFDAIIYRDEDRDVLIPVLERRVQYLRNRAQQWAERTSARPGQAWELAATRATLHFEVAESAALLGNFDDARFQIGLAVHHFHTLRMPYGVALQRAFVADHGSLASHGNEVLAGWKAELARGSDIAIDDAMKNAAIRSVIDVPQQWAYYGLCSAFSAGPAPFEIDTDALSTRLRNWVLVPVGRMRFPMDHYIYIIEYCQTARRTQGDVDGQTPHVVDIIAKQIVALWRAVGYARVNRYLWKRLLAPAPWFDFDVALLVAAVLASPGALSTNLAEAVAGAIPTEAADYAAQFIDTVHRLMAR